MTIIDDIIAEDIQTKLELITVVNGYQNNVSVLPGYMVHYANDLMDAGLTDKSFPAVSFQPEDDTPDPDPKGTRSKSDRTMKLIGAVDVIDPALVNSKVNSLLADVRKALAMNKFDNKSKAMEIIIGRAIFNLPDSKDQYAFFEMSITIKYLEVWVS